jgi:fumarylacetoacetase
MNDDDTLNPALDSWVASANTADTEFPIQNLPYGRFRRHGTQEAWRIGVAIGDQVLDLQRATDTLARDGELRALLQPLVEGDMNRFMALPAAQRALVRRTLSRALRHGSPQHAALASCLVAQADVEYSVPCHIGDYTDFYTGIHHATTVGKLFRPDNPLLPNYKWVPIGYHGRASSIVPSGQGFRRPRGQTKAADATEPSLTPSRRLDYELELGIYLAGGNALGEPVAMSDAESHVFGLGLLNDWSARDVQAWEYQPLGPFLSKNFATTVSPWIVTLEALAPFRHAFERPAGDPAPLPYLDSPANRGQGAIDIVLEVHLQTAAMRAQGLAPHRLSRSNFRDAYWTFAQLVAHHTVNGCNLQPGDLLGTGTLSGPAPEQAGSLLELTLGGTQRITLPGGETRAFLEDGDTVTLRGFCERAGARRIGFGECSATVLAAVDQRP